MSSSKSDYDSNDEYSTSTECHFLCDNCVDEIVIDAVNRRDDKWRKRFAENLYNFDKHKLKNEIGERLSITNDESNYMKYTMNNNNVDVRDK